LLSYSGHAIASAGENYLIPVDVDEPSTVELSVQGMKQARWWPSYGAKPRIIKKRGM
jgi:hypothetical protein